MKYLDSNCIAEIKFELTLRYPKLLNCFNANNFYVYWENQYDETFYYKEGLREYKFDDLINFLLFILEAEEE